MDKTLLIDMTVDMTVLENCLGVYFLLHRSTMNTGIEFIFVSHINMFELS